MHLGSLFAFTSRLKFTLILAEMCILECVFEDHICIWKTHLHLYFGCNAHILENVRAFERSHLYLYFSYNVHLF